MMDFGFYNMDCLEGMKQFPDKYFDLAIVDPPYGDGGAASQTAQGSEKDLTVISMINRGGGTENTSITLGTRHYTFGARKKYSTYQNRRNLGNEVFKKIIAWDVAPKQEYFDELFRVSRNQIIWGGNYFNLPPTRCFLIWRKLSISEGFSMAMAEYAWTSFNDNAKVFECAPQGKTDDPRFHPTQKPIALYEWILSRYAKEGDTILDTHVGSASSLIACHLKGYKYVGFEIDTEYYSKAQERIKRYTNPNYIDERNQIEGQMNIMDFIGSAS